jgi:hypothetical protein
MRKFLFFSLLFVFFALSMSDASESRIASKNIDLSGVTEIAFELGPPSAFGLSLAKYDFAINGGGKANGLALSLAGDISSNQKSARPDLCTERRGSRLVVRLFKPGSFFVFLAQSGSVHFSATVPDGFAGRVSVSSSAGRLTLSGLSPDELDVKSSSGSIAGSTLSPGRFDISSSSGSIKLSSVSAEKARIVAHSGSIDLGTLDAASSATVESSSGSIRIGELSGPELSIRSSAGSIDIDDVSGNLVCDASSGSVRLAASRLSGSLTVDSSAGSVTLELPRDAAFSAQLKVSAGSIRSDFSFIGDVGKQERDRLTGDANGGGYPVKVDVSSGGIRLIAR